MTLAPEDANSKLFNVVSVAESDVDDEERVGDSLDFDVQYIDAEVWWRFPIFEVQLRFWSWSLVHIWKLMFGWGYKIDLVKIFKLIWDVQFMDIL